MLERGEQVNQFTLQVPVFDASFFAGLMRWGMMFIVIGIALWGMYELFRRFSLVEKFTSYGGTEKVEDL
jgi:hypothetical protein